MRVFKTIPTAKPRKPSAWDSFILWSPSGTYLGPAFLNEETFPVMVAKQDGIQPRPLKKISYKFIIQLKCRPNLEGCSFTCRLFGQHDCAENIINMKDAQQINICGMEVFFSIKSTITANDLGSGIELIVLRKVPIFKPIRAFSVMDDLKLLFCFQSPMGSITVLYCSSMGSWVVMKEHFICKP